jgi:hypothetical protein
MIIPVIFLLQQTNKFYYTLFHRKSKCNINKNDKILIITQ